MNLADYPTPENDKFTAFLNGADDAIHLVALDLFSRDLERRLAACRDVLSAINNSQIMDVAVHREITNTLILTAPSTNPKP
jgi:polyphosphate kinase